MSRTRCVVTPSTLGDPRELLLRRLAVTTGDARREVECSRRWAAEIELGHHLIARLARVLAEQHAWQAEARRDGWAAMDEAARLTRTWHAQDEGVVG